MTCIVGGEHEVCISVLVREPGSMPAYSCEGNVQVGLKQFDFDSVNCTGLSHDKVCLILMIMVMNLQFHLRNICMSRIVLLWSNKF